MSLADWWRLANVVLAVLVGIWLAVDLVRNDERLSLRRQLLTIALGSFILISAVVSLEDIAEGNPLGFRAPLITLSLLFVAFGLGADPGGQD